MSLPASNLNKQADNRTTMELGACLPMTAEVKDDHLFIGGVDMVELAHEYGTALYVYDEADLVNRMDTYRDAFRTRYPNSDIAYASKAFLNKAVCRLANKHGMCLDVSGGGELAVARAVDFPMDRVIVHGNNKTPQELREAIEAFAEITTSEMIKACKKYGLKEPRLICEPGRSLVATPGVTLYTVGILKTLPGIRKYVAIDGGMSDNIRTALYHAEYEPVIANKAGQPRTEIVTLCGKHCESGDAVALDASIQHPDLGDIVCVFGTGAYCHSMSSNYNGQPRPGIVFVKDGVARLVTRRETYDDLMACDID